MKEKLLERISLVISLLPLTLFIVRHLKIGLEAPWLYIIFAAYAAIIIISFAFAIYLVKNKTTRSGFSKAALTLSSLYVAFFSFFIYLTIAERLQ